MAISPNDENAVGPFKITVSKNINGARRRWYWWRDTWDEAVECQVLAKMDLRQDPPRDPYERYDTTHLQVRPRGQTVRQWAEIWLAAQDLDRRVRENYRQKLEHDLLGEFGSLGVAEVRHIAMQGWYTRLKRTPRERTGMAPAPGTVAGILSLVDSIFTAAKLEGIIETNPCDGLKRPSVPRIATVRPAHLLTPAQVVAVAEQIGKATEGRHPRRDERTGKPVLTVPERRARFRDLTLVLGFTGARPEELEGLRRRPQEVKLMRRPPAIQVVEPIKRGPKEQPEPDGPKSELYHGEPKSEAGARLIELIQPLADIIAVRMASGRPYVFGGRTGQPVQHPDYWSMFKDAGKELGHPEWTPYDLRHSLASWGQRWPRRALKEMLGHAPADTTEGYQLVSAADRAEIRADLQRLWDEGWAGYLGGDLEGTNVRQAASP